MAEINSCWVYDANKVKFMIYAIQNFSNVKISFSY
jgi:hypothetical protein